MTVKMLIPQLHSEAVRHSGCVFFFSQPLIVQSDTSVDLAMATAAGTTRQLDATNSTVHFVTDLRPTTQQCWTHSTVQGTQSYYRSSANGNSRSLADGTPSRDTWYPAYPLTRRATRNSWARRRRLPVSKHVDHRALEGNESGRLLPINVRMDEGRGR